MRSSCQLRRRIHTAFQCAVRWNDLLLAMERWCCFVLGIRCIESSRLLTWNLRVRDSFSQTLSINLFCTLHCDTVSPEYTTPKPCPSPAGPLRLPR